MQDLKDICLALQNAQRQRSIVIKSRIMQDNRLQAVVAGTIGYNNTMAEKERTAKFVEAAALIKNVLRGKAESQLSSIIIATGEGTAKFDHLQQDIEAGMKTLAEQLPVAEWVALPGQRGFGLSNLAVVIGETGDLSNYANPGKVWRRLGCAPWTFDGQTMMGSTWRRGKEGKLPASEWEMFGYSPRRRSIAYNVGEPLMKLNKGPYRARYDESKVVFRDRHPEYKAMRCHLHGLLCCAKLLLKNLWIEWNKAGDAVVETECSVADRSAMSRV